MMVLQVKPGLNLGHKSLMLARDTLLRSGLDDKSRLVASDSEDRSGVPVIYFDFETPDGKVKRLYPK